MVTLRPSPWLSVAVQEAIVMGQQWPVDKADQIITHLCVLWYSISECV
jgi:hypothetical protein